MRIEKDRWPYITLVARRRKINPSPQYQRGDVWTREKQQLLIDSMLRRYDIPKIYLNEPADRALYDYEVLDGQQRLRALLRFRDNELRLGEETDQYLGKAFDELPQEVRDELDAYTFEIVIIRDATEDELSDMFLRLQKGTPLNAAEKRNAIPGRVRDFCREVGASHPVFGKSMIREDRFVRDEIAAIVLLVELQNGPVDAKAKDLERIYRDRAGDFDADGDEAKRVRRILNILDRLFSPEFPEFKWYHGFIDIALLIREMDREYDLSSVEPGEFREFLRSLHEERLTLTPEDVVGGDEWAAAVVSYNELFMRRDRSSYERKLRILKRRFLHNFPEIVPKDRQRLFGEDERWILWVRAEKRCQQCGREIARLEEMVADHVIPYARGGQTTIANGQCLCMPCNAAKAARV